MTAAAERGRRAGELAQKVILGFIAGAAVSIGVIEVVLMTIRAIAIAANDAVDITGLRLAEPITPAFLEGIEGVTAGSFDSVSLTILGLSGGARAVLVGATIISSLLAITVCAAVAWLALRVFLGKPFVASATWGIGAVAIMAIVVGFVNPTLIGVAHAEVAAQLGLRELPAFLVELDLAPIAWGLALAVVGAAFELGQRMQRDSEGLV